MGIFKGIKRGLSQKKSPVLAKQVRFAYGDKEILKNFNLHIRTSQIVAVVGRSGEGKSTFLNLLSGVLTHTYKGKISILGQHRQLAKEDIGYVPQDVAVIPDLNIEENIVFFGRVHGIRKEETLRAGKELMKLLQLEMSLSRYPSELSGGQKTRLNIVVSFLHNPKVLILDEPFVGLDYHNRKLLWHFLQYQRNRRKTVVLTTHLLTEAEHHTDHIVLLHKGKIFARGKLKDIRKKLKTQYLVEVKFPALSKTSEKNIRLYCSTRNISIMDAFNNYIMFSVQSSGQRAYLFRYFDKLRISYEELGFREPNLDELFLTVKSA